MYLGTVMTEEAPSLEALLDLGNTFVSSSNLTWLGHACHKIILLLGKNSSQYPERVPHYRIAPFEIFRK